MSKFQLVANPFVRRQTARSRFSHFDGPTEELIQIVQEVDCGEWRGVSGGHCKFNAASGIGPFCKQHVSAIPIPDKHLHRFKSGVVQLTLGSRLVGRYEARRDGETPRKSVSTPAPQGYWNKLPAKSVEIIVYSSTLLAKDGDNWLPSEDGNWEIVSINANPFDGPMPIAPDTLMHNHFGSDGGTATGLSDSEFVSALRESFEFWKDKAMCDDS